MSEIIDPTWTPEELWSLVLEPRKKDRVQALQYLIAVKRGQTKHIRLTETLPLCRIHSNNWMWVSYLDVTLLQLFPTCKRCESLDKEGHNHGPSSH